MADRENIETHAWPRTRAQPGQIVYFDGRAADRGADVIDIDDLTIDLQPPIAPSDVPDGLPQRPAPLRFSISPAKGLSTLLGDQTLADNIGPQQSFVTSGVVATTHC